MRKKYFQLFSIQGNLSIADMLYSGHISIADTFSRNQLSQATVKLIYFGPLCSGHLPIADTLPKNKFSLAMAKPLYFEPLYSEHLSIADTFSENQWCPLLRGFTVVLHPNYEFKYEPNMKLWCYFMPPD